MPTSAHNLRYQGALYRFRYTIDSQVQNHRTMMENWHVMDDVTGSYLPRQFIFPYMHFLDLCDVELHDKLVRV